MVLDAEVVDELLEVQLPVVVLLDDHRHAAHHLLRVDHLGEVADDARVLLSVRADIVGEPALPAARAELVHVQGDLEAGHARHAVRLVRGDAEVDFRLAGLADGFHDVGVSEVELEGRLGHVFEGQRAEAVPLRRVVIRRPLGSRRLAAQDDLRDCRVLVGARGVDGGEHGLVHLQVVCLIRPEHGHQTASDGMGMKGHGREYGHGHEYGRGREAAWAWACVWAWA